MAEVESTANGADKSASPIPPAIPATAPAAPQARPAVPARSPLTDRFGGGGSAGFGAPEPDPMRSLAPAVAGNRLQATTGMMNAYFRYLSTVHGRPLDELRESDVTALGSIMAILDGIEPAGRKHS